MREPELDALQYWCDLIKSADDVGLVTSAILKSVEYQKLAVERVRRDRCLSETLRRVALWFVADPLFVVDVGAQELADEAHVYDPLITADLHCRILGFEPLEGKVSSVYADRPNTAVTLSPTFVGDGQRHTFHINNYDATSSLLPFNLALTSELAGLSGLRTVSTQAVATESLDVVLAGFERIDFLKLDIQGFELTALQNATLALERTNVVHCEVSFAEIYEGQGLFSEVESLLRRNGFEFLDLSTECRYPYHCKSQNKSEDRLGWGDAIFFKRPVDLRSSRDLLAQAVIALAVYHKHSLGEFLLEQFDAREGTQLVSGFQAP